MRIGDSTAPKELTSAESSEVFMASELVARRAGERLPAPPELAELFPEGLPLGNVLLFSGKAGAGATGLCCRTLSVISKSLPVGLFDPEKIASPRAVVESGAALDHFYLVRPVDARDSRSRAASVLGALIDGFAAVGVIGNTSLSSSLWYRVAGRVRERNVLLVVADVAPAGRSSVGSGIPRDVASMTVELSSPLWELDAGGLLASRKVDAHVRGRGMRLRSGVIEWPLCDV